MINLIALAILFILAAPVLLVVLLKPALQYVDGGRRRPDFLLAVWVAALLDVIVARTAFVLIFGWPRWREITVSQALQRICNEGEHPRLQLAIEVSREINNSSPTGRHIDLKNHATRIRTNA